MQDKIFDLLMQKDEIGWKEIIYDLVKTEQMDPWDVNLNLLTNKYIQIIKEMQEHDLIVSGKILLAAAILLKIKSSHLLENDISRLDLLLNQTEEEIDEEFFDDFSEGRTRKKMEQYTLIPRNPQPRNRKVSVQDLVNALQRAMSSKKKILARMKPVQFKRPDRRIDIMEAINDIFQKVVYYSKKEKNQKITFSTLLPVKASKEEKVFTFLPLLHLENQNKVEMEQKSAFEEIHVSLLKKK